MFLHLPGWLTGLTSDGAPYEPKGSWALYRSRIGEYMDRLILKTPWGTLRAHRILREDRSEDPHDHPFNFTSLIVWGGYEEEFFIDPVDRPEVVVRRWFKRGDVNSRDASDAHKITRVLPRTLTLVVSSRKIKSWGFYLPRRGWLYWRDYFGGRAAR